MKENIRFRIIRTVLMALLMALVSSSMGAQITHDDGDFVNWSGEFKGTAGSAASFVVVPQGGNPGAYLEATTDSGWAHLLMWSNDYVIDPALQGPLHSIAYQVDVASVSAWGQGQAIYLLVLQDGMYFIPAEGNLTGAAPEWQTLPKLEYTSDQFVMVDDAAFQTPGVGPWTLGDPTITPDFTVGGSVIRLGFVVGNHVSGIYVNNYDNWHIEATLAASASFRNAGANPASHVAVTLPVLGSTYTATVDLAGTTGHYMAWLFGYSTPFSFTLGGGQVLLLNVADPGGELLGQSSVLGPIATYSLPVPADVVFAGVQLATQALHFGGVQPFALSNAQDLMLGF